MRGRLSYWNLLGAVTLLSTIFFLSACGGGNTSGKDQSPPPQQSSEQAKTSDKTASEKPAAVKSQPPPPLKQVKLAIPSTGLTFSVFTIIDKKGFFQNEGIKFETIQMPSSTAMPALLNGDVDFAQHSGSAARAAAQGMPVKILFYFGGKPHHVLLAIPKINSITDLKGTAIGIAGKGDTTEVTTRLLLEKAGMSIKDVTLIAVGSSAQMLAALSGNTLAATMISGETGLIASQKMGYKVLARASEVVEAPITGVVAADAKVANDLDTVKAVLRAHVKGINYVTNPANKQEIIDLLLSDASLKLENDRDLATKLYELIASVFTRNGLVSDKAIKAELDQIKADLQLSDLKNETIYNFTVLQQIVKELGL